MTPEEKQRLLEDRAAKLASLKTHPHWDELLAEFDRKRARNEKTYTAYLAGGDTAAAQRAYDRAEGFDAALTWVRRVVENAEDTLNKALGKRQEEGEQ